MRRKQNFDRDWMYFVGEVGHMQRAVCLQGSQMWWTESGLNLLRERETC